MRNRQTIDYSDCDNLIDPVTQFPFEAGDDIVFIFDNGKWTCFSREGILQLFKQPDSRMAYWVGGDAVGYGGRPDLSRRVYKLPDGTTWIDRKSRRLIEKAENKYFVRQLIERNVPIGNVYGQLGVSMLHGNNPQSIYRLIPMPEDKSELNAELNAEMKFAEQESDLSDIELQMEEKEGLLPIGEGLMDEWQRMVETQRYGTWIQFQMTHLNPPPSADNILNVLSVNNWVQDLTDSWETTDSRVMEWIEEKYVDAIPLDHPEDVRQVQLAFSRAIQEGNIYAMLALRPMILSLSPAEQEYEPGRWFLVDAILSQQWDIVFLLMNWFSFHEPVIMAIEAIIFQMATTDDNAVGFQQIILPAIALNEQLWFVQELADTPLFNAYISQLHSIYEFASQPDRISNPYLRTSLVNLFESFFQWVRMSFS